MEQPSHIRHYNKALKEYAGDMRKSGTKAEAWLWKLVLKNKQVNGYTFNRQRPVLHYIADFMCKELKLIIEVDGGYHNDSEAQINDFVKTQELTTKGYTVIRFTNDDILKDIDSVRTRIEEVVETIEFQSKG